MTKESYIYFSEKDLDYLNKAKLLFGLYIAIFVSLIVLMFVYQIYSYFVTFIIVLLIMYLLYRFVFLDYIYYIRKLGELKRIKLMKRFDLVDDVLEYFSGEIYKQLFDDDFLIIHKNDAYVLAKIELEDSIYALGLAVYNMDNSTDEVCPSTRELSNELTGYIANSSVIKVILLIREKFEEDELDLLQYDSAIHKNTVVIGIEKSTSQLIYNYFLNGEIVDTYLSELFQVNLVREDTNY